MENLPACFHDNSDLGRTIYGGYLLCPECHGFLLTLGLLIFPVLGKLLSRNIYVAVELLIASMGDAQKENSLSLTRWGGILMI